MVHLRMIVAIDVHEIAEFIFSEMLQDVCLPHLSCTLQNERFAMDGRLPVKELLIDGSFHKLQEMIFSA